jgi:transposase
LKSEFEVAPVFLKEVSRIQALLCLYFLVLLVQAFANLPHHVDHSSEHNPAAHCPSTGQVQF